MKGPPRWTLGFVVALSTMTAIVLAVSIFFIHGPSTRPDELSYLLNGCSEHQQQTTSSNWMDATWR